jgi:hypothetical protein
VPASWARAASNGAAAKRRMRISERRRIVVGGSRAAIVLAPRLRRKCERPRNGASPASFYHV